MPSHAKGTVSDDVKAMLGSVKQLTKFEMDAEMEFIWVSLTFFSLFITF